MTLRELQLHICEILNADETLLHGRCKAFAEDALDARLTPEPALHAGAGGVALVVRTPSARLAGAPIPVVERSEGTWSLVNALAPETIEALAAQGYANLSPVSVADDALHIGDYSVAVRVDGSNAYYLGGDFIIGFRSGDLVATYAEGRPKKTGAKLPVSATLAVDCIEIPAVNRGEEPFVSAMGAAERVAHLLSCGTRSFDRFESDLIDSKEQRFYVFTAYFVAHITHTQPKD